MIIKIKKPRFKKLNFFVSLTINASVIPKTVIFVNNIKIADKMITHL